jgi:ribosome-binding protein aMBF1 (putative translation factor)
MPTSTAQSKERKNTNRTRRGTHIRNEPSLEARRSRPRPRTATEILDQITGDDEDLRQLVAQATVSAELAEMLYEARTRAGLTQRELARRLGIRQPLISRLEEGEYTGHSWATLQRIATALGCRLELRLVRTAPKRIR